MRTGYDNKRGLRFDEFEEWEISDGVIIHADHAYIDKKWINGKWRYFYDEKLGGKYKGMADRARTNMERAGREANESYKRYQSNMTMKNEKAWKRDRDNQQASRNMYEYSKNKYDKSIAGKIDKVAPKAKAAADRLVDIVAKGKKNANAAAKAVKDQTTRLKNKALDNEKLNSKIQGLSAKNPIRQKWNQLKNRRDDYNARVNRNQSKSGSGHARDEALKTTKFNNKVGATEYKVNSAKKAQANFDKKLAEQKATLNKAAQSKREAGYAKDYQKAYANSSAGKAAAQDKREKSYGDAQKKKEANAALKAYQDAKAAFDKNRDPKQVEMLRKRREAAADRMRRFVNGRG